MSISKKLRDAVKLSERRQYELAREIGLGHPGTLSSWLNGAYSPREGDPRVLRLAEILGVPIDEAFETTPEPSTAEKAQHAQAQA